MVTTAMAVLLFRRVSRLVRLCTPDGAPAILVPGTLPPAFSDGTGGSGCRAP